MRHCSLPKAVVPNAVKQDSGAKGPLCGNSEVRLACFYPLALKMDMCDVRRPN